MQIVNIVASIATIIALVIAVIQLNQAKDQARQLEEVGKTLSTRYVSDFPDYIPEVIDLIKKAKRSLYILCDFPGCSLFSDREGFANYKIAIERQMRADIKIEFICLASAQREKWLRKQFADAGKNWDVWRKTQPNKDRLSIFCKQCIQGSNLNPDTIRFEDLLSYLEAENVYLVKHDFSNIKPIEVNTYITTHLWIRDGEEAVFAIPSVKQGEREVCFRTNDKRLVDALIIVFDSFKP